MTWKSVRMGTRRTIFEGDWRQQDRKRWLKGGAIQCQVQGTFLGIHKDGPAKTLSNRGCIAWTFYLLWPGKSSSRGVGIPAYSHNFLPRVCPDYAMGCSKNGVEIEGMTNQWLVQYKTPSTIMGQSLTLPGVPGPRDWRYQRTRIETSIIEEKYVNILRPNNILLYTETVPLIIIFRDALSSKWWKQIKNAQSNIRLNSGDPAKERKE